MLGLLTDMGMYLAGAAIIGLIIGWAFRGAFLPRPKTVNVSQNIAPPPVAEYSDEQKAALERAEQAETTISALEARVKTAQEAAATSQGEVNQLKQALQAAQAQLATVKEEAASVQSAAIAPSPSLTPTAKDTYENDPKLEWTSRYLEARVRHLESQLADKPDVAQAPAVDTSALEAEIASLKANAEETEARLKAALDEQQTVQSKLNEAQVDAPAVSLADFAKNQWQNRYLKARLLHLEENAPSVEAPVAPVAETDTSHEVDTLKSEITVLKAELDRISGADTDAEKELASLRWRNRYLEGRLKYLEAASLDAASDADDRTDGVAAALSDVAAPVTDMPVEKEIESLIVDALPQVDPQNEVRPLSLDAPRGGQPDDLKRIGGIGPKIEGILNELGIFHFDQVSAWTNEEAAWIDSYLRFQGRVQREKWVDQATSLEKAKSAAAE